MYPYNTRSHTEIHNSALSLFTSLLLFSFKKKKKKRALSRAAFKKKKPFVMSQRAAILLPGPWQPPPADLSLPSSGHLPFVEAPTTKRQLAGR